MISPIDQNKFHLAEHLQSLIIFSKKKKYFDGNQISKNLNFIVIKKQCLQQQQNMKNKYFCGICKQLNILIIAHE